MSGKRIVKVISNVIYSIGTVITLLLVLISLFGANVILNPDAMLPSACNELAFIWLSVGSIPMLLACAAVYIFNGIKNTERKKLNFFLIFLPGFICSGCFLYVIGVIAAGFLNLMFHWW